MKRARSAESVTVSPGTEPETAPLTLRGSFGTAVGAAMLGLDQALRDAPPPQVQAAEHTPDRRTVAGRDDLTIEFPEPPGDVPTRSD